MWRIHELSMGPKGPAMRHAISFSSHGQMPRANITDILALLGSS